MEKKALLDTQLTAGIGHILLCKQLGQVGLSASGNICLFRGQLITEVNNGQHHFWCFSLYFSLRIKSLHINITIILHWTIGRQGVGAVAGVMIIECRVRREALRQCTHSKLRWMSPTAVPSIRRGCYPQCCEHPIGIAPFLHSFHKTTLGIISGT